MHGVIGLGTIALRNRRGRKRKQGRRSPVTGDLVKAQVDYRAMAGEQPHRVILPERFRLDHRAGTVLGELLLTGQLNPHGRDGKPSERALALYEAGARFRNIVGNYHAIIAVPRGTAGAGKSYGCTGDENCEPTTCECVRRKRAYNDSHNALFCAGRTIQITVNRVVVHDEPCNDWQLPALIIGLGTLAREFGLKS